MAKRPRHPNKDIERAIATAEGQDWIYKTSNGHPWGRLLCPFADRNGCIISVWSTPKNPPNHARQIVAALSRCPHNEQDENEGG